MSTQATGMYAVIKDWSIYATDMQIMHERLSGNNEEKALDMRREIAQSVVDTYANDGDDNTNITMEQALGYVDAQYKALTGQSIVDTIGQTTKSANSFWNYVPIVNWFVDDTTAEDLYAYMDGEKPDTQTAEHKVGKVASTAAQGAAIGAGLGLCGGPFAPLTCTAGAIIGGIAGLFAGLVD